MTVEATIVCVENVGLLKANIKGIKGHTKINHKYMTDVSPVTRTASVSLVIHFYSSGELDTARSIIYCNLLLEVVGITQLEMVSNSIIN